jgi:beta-galactosidase
MAACGLRFLRRQIGDSQDSHMTSERNITRKLMAGRDTVAVEVYRWREGSYIED